MKMDRVPLGIGDAEVEAPSHICLFHDGEAQSRPVRLAFLRPAIEDPRQAMLLYGRKGVAERQLALLEADLGRSLSDEIAASRIYLAAGDPEPDAQLENLIEPIERLLAGHTFVRIVGTTAWDVTDFPPPEDFLWFESRVTALIADWPVVVLCAYDVSVMPGIALAYGGLQTHPLVLTNGRLGASPMYVPPDRYVSHSLMPLLNGPSLWSGGTAYQP
jgi:hypothetical protein